MHPNNKDFLVHLPVFEVPLELMLYLIKSKKLEINKIAISLITSEFLEFVEDYKKRGHTFIAEFINAAATLLFLKSCSILPIKIEGDFVNESEDRRMELVTQLIEYQKAQQMMQYLDLRKNNLILFRKPNQDLSGLKHRVNFQEATFRELLNSYCGLFVSPSKTQLIIDRTQKVFASVEDKIQWLLSKIKNRLKSSFFRLIKDLKLDEVIITFLASLEMARQKKVVLHQEEQFGDIILENKNEFVDRKQEQEEIA